MDALLLALVNNNDGDDYEKVNLKENFIALFLPRSVRQMLANSSGDCIEVQEKKRKQKQNAKLGIFTSQWCRDGKKNVHKSVRAKLLFCSSKAISILVAVAVDVASAPYRHVVSRKVRIFCEA